MNLINPYNKNSKFTNFLDLDEQISKYYDVVHDHESEIDSSYKLISPRYTCEGGLKVGFRDIFYYIDLLYYNSPEKIVDVGCGECIFKNWFPNIIGFDPLPSKFSNADFVDYFDEDFVKGHKNLFSGAMALNSIHFVPWIQLKDQIELAMELVKINSRFLFTFNFEVLDEWSEPNCQIAKGSLDDKFEYFSNILDSLTYKKIVVDSPLHKGMSIIDLQNYVSFVNGTVRIILEK
jgi:hypothetical protein